LYDYIDSHKETRAVKILIYLQSLMPVQDQVLQKTCVVLTSSLEHPLLAHVGCSWFRRGRVHKQVTREESREWQIAWSRLRCIRPLPQPTKPTIMQAIAHALLYIFRTGLNQSECLLHDHIFIKYFTKLFHLH